VPVPSKSILSAAEGSRRHGSDTEGSDEQRRWEDSQIPLPPLAEQKHIAAILDKADTVRRKRQEAIRLTEEFLRSVFLDMFGDPVTNPREWEKAPIKNLATVITGNTPSREKSEYYGDYIEWIKSDNINTPYHLVTEAEERLSEEGKAVGRVVSAGSILVTCIAGSYDCIGNAALADRKVAFNQQINAVTPLKHIDPYFLYMQILIAKQVIQNASTHSMKGMVNKGRFEQILLLNPPAHLQKKFGTIFQKTLAMHYVLDDLDKRGHELFNSLTQSAFRGELVSEGLKDTLVSKRLEHMEAGREATKAKQRSKGSKGLDSTKMGSGQAKIRVAGEKPSAQLPPIERAKKKHPPHSPRSSHKQSRGAIESLETDEVMAAFRKACRGRGAMTREELLREVAQVFGYKRLGFSVGERLKGHVRAAIRRGIVEADGEWVRSATRSIDDYSRDALIDTLHSVMQSGKLYDREAVIRAAGEHLGFSKVNDRIRGAFRSAIRKGVRTGKIISDRNTIWRL